MVADIEKTLKYPLNFKPLFTLGMIFVIALIVFIVPLFFLGAKVEKENANTGIFTPFMIIYILLYLAAMVIISILLSGYMIRVSRSIMAGNLDKAPELTGIRSMCADGLKFAVIGFAYAVPPVIIMVLAFFILGAMALFLMLFLIPLFYVPHLAGAHLAYTNSLRKALDIPYVYSLIFNHLKGFTLSLFFYFVASVIFFIAGLLIVTYPFIIVASYVAGQYIFTIFYMESAGLIEEIKW